MYFSKSTIGFYDHKIHGANIPDDAVEITGDQHAALLTGQSAGMRISADETGYPVLIDPLITRDQLLLQVTSERLKRWRGGFPVLVGGVTNWFHSDEFSLTQHLGLKDKARDLLAAGGLISDNITIGGQPVSWSTMDGAQVQITVQVAFDIVAAAALNQAMIFAASKAHETAINAPAVDLTGYDVLTNWPAVFVE